MAGFPRSDPAEVERPEVSREDALGLTRQQLQLYIEGRLHPDLAIHNVVHTATFHGAVDPAAFAAAFEALVRDADALRTVVDRVDGVPRQWVVPEVLGALEQVDLSAFPVPLAAFANWRDQHARRPLDPSRRCFESALIRLAPDRYTWYLNVHHVVYDGWSAQVLMERMSDLYERARSGALDGRPPLPSFRDHVVGQLAREQSTAARVDRAFWEERLAREVPAASLYGNPPAPGSVDVAGHVHLLGVARTRRLNALVADPRFPGRHRDGLLSDLLLTAFAVFLHKASGNREFTVGMPVMSRRRGQDREIVGQLMQVLPVRIAIDPEDTYVSLFRRIAAERTEIAGRRLYVPGNLRGQLFQITFNYDNRSYGPFAGIPTRHKGYQTAHELALCTHVRNPRAKSMVLLLEFARALFPEEQRARATRHLLNAVDALLDDPSRRVARVDVLGTGERDAISRFSRGPDRPLPDHGVLELFGDRVAATPDATVLVTDEERVSYALLDRRVRRIAAGLRRIGVARGERVGLFLERSVDQVAALLGILAVGGSYVPLDPSYPQERLAFMAGDAGLRVVVTREGLRGRNPAPAAALLIMEDLAGREAAAGDAPPVRAGPESCAYVLYTSGSTGRPKGVEGLHRGILNRLQWIWSTYPYRQGDVGCLRTSLSFVASVAEILAPLLGGCPAVVIDETDARDPRRLVDALARHGVTRITLVPSLLESMLSLEEDLASRLPALRTWISSGETLSRDLATRFHERVPGRILLNLYGSTEVGAAVTCHQVEAAPADGPGSVPVGTPHHNTTIRVKDAAGLATPIGVQGEIWVGGAGLARGFLNEPQGTASGFGPAPSGEPDRMFRTGDLGRWRPDGSLEFLGRRDTQVKIRGNRVEPGEVEAVLKECVRLREAAVVARVRETGGAELVAFVVPENPAVFSPRDVRAYARERLPQFMVPGVVIRLPELPRLPNGKLDREALPLAAVEIRESRSVTAPASETERRLLGVFESVLDARPIGVEDSFFDLGGDSIALVEALPEIERVLGRPVAIEAVLRFPTVRQMVQSADRVEVRTPHGSPLVAVQPDGTRPPFFCVPPAGSPASTLVLLAKELGPDQPFFAFRHRGLEKGEKPHRRVEEMAEEFIDAMRAVQPRGPYRIGGRCFGGLVAFEMAKRLLARGDTVALLVLLDTLRPPGVTLPPKLPRPLRRLRRAVRGRRWFGLRRAKKLRGSKRRLKRVVMAHYRARARYGSSAYPGRIHLFCSGELGRRADLRGRWAEFALEGVENHLFPCGHRELLREPIVRDVAARLAALWEE